MMSRTNGSSCSRHSCWTKDDHHQLNCLARVQSAVMAKGEHLEMYTGKQNLKSIESNQGYSRDTVSAWSAWPENSVDLEKSGDNRLGDAIGWRDFEPPGVFSFQRRAGAKLLRGHTRLYHPACGSLRLGPLAVPFFLESYPGPRLGSDLPAGFLRAPKGHPGTGLSSGWAEVSGGCDSHAVRT
jgi:hypothetical protein